MGHGALLEPVDRKLHDAAVDYCNRELKNGSEINLSKFAKVWIAKEGEEIVGIAAFVWRLDVPMFRVTGSKADRATNMLAERIRSYFQDAFGARGAEAFIHLSSKETPEQRCEKWDESLAKVGAVPADRFSVEI